MLFVLLAGLGLVFATEIAAAAPSPADLEAYESARQDVGRDPAAHIRLALWCEAHGLRAEEQKHLALAVLLDPANPTARGLMGLAAYRGSWQRPEAILAKVKADEDLTARLAEYNARRARMAATADDHWKLALWCEEHGLEAEAKAHLTTVTRLDPARDAAWIRLGCKKLAGRWVTEAQLDAEKTEAEAQQKADRYWKPLLVKWRSWLGDKARRGDAERDLQAVSDPRAARSVWQVFGRAGEASQERAVQMLAPLDCLASTRALALLATWGASREVRRVAADVLRNRDPREYVGFLLELQRKEYRVVAGAIPIRGNRLRTALTIEGDKLLISPALRTVTPHPLGTDMIVTATFNTVWNPPRLFTDDVPLDSPVGEWYAYTSAWPGSLGGPMASPAAARMVQQMVAQPQNAAAIVSAHQASRLAGPAAHGHAGAGLTPDQQTSLFVQNWMTAARFRDAQVYWANSSPINRDPNFDNHVSYYEDLNREIRESNTQIFDSLNRITGQDLPEDPEAWRKWYSDALGYAYTPTKEKPEKPKVMVFVSLPSCFAAGTQVRTLLGPRPIETIEVGDQVLAQDPLSGKLTFETVNAVHHNPPGETLKIRLGSEKVLPSIYHRFWCAGRGWVMARDLKPGDEVRTLGGRVRVDSVAPGAVQKVYNLDVAGSHSFFVGTEGALVHDNSLPALRAERFDVAADLDRRGRE
jgi:hypothetical protein